VLRSASLIQSEDGVSQTRLKPRIANVRVYKRQVMDSFGRCCGCPYTVARFVGIRWISRMSPWCTVAT
jgi:hypothetical protein